MPLVFAGIAPHTPLLLKHIGKEKTTAFSATLDAYKTLEEQLYAAKPDIVVILSGHCALFDNVFSINAHTDMQTDFVQFGDMSIPTQWQGSPKLASRIAHKGKRASIPVRLTSTVQLHHGVSVPLFLLTKHLPRINILPIGHSLQGKKEHIVFGETLKEVFAEAGERIAVVVAAEIIEEDQKKHTESINIVKKVFTDNTLTTLSNITSEISAPLESIHYSLLIISGILHDMPFSFETYCTESVHGIHCTTGQFVF